MKRQAKVKRIPAYWVVHKCGHRKAHYYTPMAKAKRMTKIECEDCIYPFEDK